jgi:hypothetical protein
MNIPSLLRKYLRSYPQWNFRPPHLQKVRNVVRMGSSYGGYFLDPSVLPSNPVIYSLGIGKDISFDLSLIEQYGCTVQAFDPTPEVGRWLESQSLPSQFRFHAAGIADFDGEANFHLPPRPDFISHSMLETKQFSAETIRVPVVTLSSAMRALDRKSVV